MKNLKKVLALLLSCTMIATALVSCKPADEKTPSTPTDGTESKTTESKTGGDLPELKFNVTTVGFGADPTGKMIQEEWIKVCGEKMGVKLVPNYTFVNMNDYKDKIQIILTGGDIPDLLSWGWVPNSAAAMIQYGEQGLYEELTQHMDKLPNYKAVLDAATNSTGALYSPDKKLYAFYGAQSQPEGTNSLVGAAAVRKDILEENKIEIPETIEQITAAAQALKKAYPDKYPLMLNEEWQRPEITIAAAYRTYADWQNGANSRYYNSDTKSYEFGPRTDGYKETLKVMNQWYKEGLISPDYFTHKSDTGTATIATGDAMIIPSVWDGYPGVWKTQYPDQKWVLVPVIKSEASGLKPLSFFGSSPDKWVMQTDYSIVVGAKSKVKDQMMQLMDTQYSTEVVDLLNWGIEGETYEVKDGERVFTAKYDPNLGASADASTAIGFGQGTCRSGIFPNIQDMTPIFQMGATEDFFYEGKLIENITPHDFATDYFDAEAARGDSLLWPKPSPLTTDEAQEYTNIMAPVETFAMEQEAKFVKGDRSFDDWAKYIEELNKMGDIQKALDLYNSKLPK